MALKLLSCTPSGCRSIYICRSLEFEKKRRHTVDEQFDHSNTSVFFDNFCLDIWQYTLWTYVAAASTSWRGCAYCFIGNGVSDKKICHLVLHRKKILIMVRVTYYFNVVHNWWFITFSSYHWHKGRITLNNKRASTKKKKSPLEIGIIQLALQTTHTSSTTPTGLPCLQHE